MTNSFLIIIMYWKFLILDMQNRFPKKKVHLKVHLIHGKELRILCLMKLTMLTKMDHMMGLKLTYLWLEKSYIWCFSKQFLLKVVLRISILCINKSNPLELECYSRGPPCLMNLNYYFVRCWNINQKKDLHFKKFFSANGFLKK